MKIFAIKDSKNKSWGNLGYLFYFPSDKKFYIELPENADSTKTPLILSSFVKRKEYTVNSYFSKLWVQQRIVPIDRQNIGQILRDNNLKEYDEFQLLLLNNGICTQDDYYINQITKKDLPQQIQERFKKKVKEVIPLSQQKVIVFFEDNSTRKIDLTSFLQQDISFAPILKNSEIFNGVKIETGGYGIAWGSNLVISNQQLYKMGIPIELSIDDLNCFIKHRIINGQEVTEILNCTRQNIDDLIKRDKLHPIKVSKKNKLFLKREIEQR